MTRDQRETVNQRNWDALCALLSDYVMGEGHGTDLDNIHLSKWLASRGVLVPSALTDEQIWDFDGVQLLPHTEEPAAMRSHLEKIAKGEA